MTNLEQMTQRTEQIKEEVKQLQLSQAIHFLEKQGYELKDKVFKKTVK